MKHSDLYSYLYQAYKHVDQTCYKNEVKGNDWTSILCDKIKDLIEQNYTCIPKSIHKLTVKELLDLIERDE